MLTARFRLLLAVTTLLMAASDAPARRKIDWPYDKLFKEADVIVLVYAIGSEASEDRLEKDSYGYKDLSGVNTSFRVVQALKGTPAGDNLTMLHFKVIPGHEEQMARSGPSLVAFQTAQAKRKGQLLPDYMLFLKARKDGRYEPVSGQIDAKLSVRIVYTPED